MVILSAFRKWASIYVRRSDVPQLIGVLFAAYVVSWGIFVLAGEPNLSNPLKALWWFVVTGTTIGYGDLFPETMVAKLLAIPVIILTVGTVAVLLSKIGAQVFENRARLRLGFMDYKGRGHAVMLGYEKGVTEELMTELRKNPDWKDRQILLCSSSIDESPFADCFFVREDITGERVAQRTNLVHATHVVVHGSTDERTVLASLHAYHANPSARMVAYVSSRAAARHIRAIAPCISVVFPLAASTAAQELADPGVASIVEDLLSQDGSSIHSCTVPGEYVNGRGRTYQWWSEALAVQGNALIGFRDSKKGASAVPELTPNPGRVVHGGSVIFAIGTGCPDPQQVLAVSL